MILIVVGMGPTSSHLRMIFEVFFIENDGYVEWNLYDSIIHLFCSSLLEEVGIVF